MGPHVRARAAPEVPRLTPLNTYILAAANPGTGKSSAFTAAVEAPMRAIEESMECSFMYSEMTKNGLLMLQESGKGYLMLGNDEAGSMLKELMTGHQADAMRSLLNCHFSGQKYGYKSGTSKDADEKTSSVATSVIAMTQQDNAAAALHHMLDNTDGLLDRFIVWAPPPRFQFAKDLADNSERIKRHPTASAENLAKLILNVHTLHLEEEHHLYTFTQEASQLLMDIRNEVVARAHWVELGHWPEATEVGEPNHDLIPDAVLGMGQTRYWETLVRIATLHHVLIQIIRCLKSGSPRMIIPSVVEVDTVVQAQEFVAKTAMAKALAIEAYCDNVGLKVPTLPPTTEKTTTIVPQPDVARINRDPTWSTERAVLFKDGQVLRVREDIKGSRIRGHTATTELETALAVLEKRGLGHQMVDTHRKRFFVKEKQPDTEALEHYGLTETIYAATLARVNSNSLVMWDDNTLYHTTSKKMVLLSPRTPMKSPIKDRVVVETEQEDSDGGDATPSTCGGPSRNTTGHPPGVKRRILQDSPTPKVQRKSLSLKCRGKRADQHSHEGVETRSPTPQEEVPMVGQAIVPHVLPADQDRALSAPPRTPMKSPIKDRVVVETEQEDSDGGDATPSTCGGPSRNTTGHPPGVKRRILQDSPTPKVQRKSLSLKCRDKRADQHSHEGVETRSPTPQEEVPMVGQAIVPHVLPADQDRALSAPPSDGED